MKCSNHGNPENVGSWVTPRCIFRWAITVTVISLLVGLSICGYLWKSRSDRRVTLASGALSDELPVLVAALREYAHTHGGGLPSLSSTEFQAFYRRNFDPPPARINRFDSKKYQDHDGTGILIWEKPGLYDGPQDLHSVGVIVYANTLDAKYVLLHRSPKEEGFTEEGVSAFKSE